MRVISLISLIIFICIAFLQVNCEKKTLYHGTGDIAAQAIFKTGFNQPERKGRIGKGIYFVEDIKIAQKIAKCTAYGKRKIDTAVVGNKPVVVVAEVELGKMIRHKKTKMHKDNSPISIEDYDSATGMHPKWETCGVDEFQEYVIFDNKNIKVTKTIPVPESHADDL